MTTDTLEAEDEMTEPGRFQMVEDMVLFHHPEWLYLVNGTLPVRPASEMEAAAYAARLEDADWAELYHPAEPRIILPPHEPEITALMDPEADGEPEAIEGVALPDHPEHAEIQQESIDALKRWGADTGSLRVVHYEAEAEAEDHHEKTVVLKAVPDSGEAS